MNAERIRLWHWKYCTFLLDKDERKLPFRFSASLISFFLSHSSLTQFYFLNLTLPDLSPLCSSHFPVLPLTFHVSLLYTTSQNFGNLYEEVLMSVFNEQTDNSHHRWNKMKRCEGKHFSTSCSPFPLSLCRNTSTSLPAGCVACKGKVIGLKWLNDPFG